MLPATAPPRAMVLAAGFGTRLRPLTEQMPKPLIPVANRPLIGWALAALARAGIRRVVINLHHLGSAIRGVLGDGTAYGLTIDYSEEPVILGTGGGVVAAREHLGRGTFLLLNGDVLSAVDPAELLAVHRRRGAVATMVVRALPAGADYTPLEVDADGWLVSLKGAQRPGRSASRRVMFCGLHALEPEVLDLLPPTGFSCINSEAYPRLLAAGAPLATYEYSGPWFDLGTPARYLEASSAVLSGQARLPGFLPPPRGVLVDETARIDPTSAIGPDVAVGAGCRIGPGCRIDHAVLWEGATLEPGTALRHAVWTPRGAVPAGASL